MVLSLRSSSNTSKKSLNNLLKSLITKKLLISGEFFKKYYIYICFKWLLKRDIFFSKNDKYSFSEYTWLCIYFARWTTDALTMKQNTSYAARRKHSPSAVFLVHILWHHHGRLFRIRFPFLNRTDTERNFWNHLRVYYRFYGLYRKQGTNSYDL